MTERVTLGSKYRDKVHGCEGVAVVRSEYLTGCARVNLEYVNKDGELKNYHFDETLLELVEGVSTNVASAADADKDPGGPGDIVPRQADVSR